MFSLCWNFVIRIFCSNACCFGYWLFFCNNDAHFYLRTWTAFFRYFYIVEGFFASSANRNCCLITVWLTAKYGIKVKNKGFSGWVSYFVRSPLKRSIFMFSHMIIELCKAWMLMQWEIMKLYLRQHFPFHFQPNGNARWMKNIAI